jgi:hypothetical protein
MDDLSSVNLCWLLILIAMRTHIQSRRQVLEGNIPLVDVEPGNTHELIHTTYESNERALVANQHPQLFANKDMFI